MRTFGFLLLAVCAGCGGSSSVPVTVEIVALDVAPQAGVTTRFEIRIFDADGAPATGIVGTARLAATDTAAQYEAEPRLAAGGATVIPVEFRTAGVQTLAVTAGTNIATATVDVRPAPAASFRLAVAADQTTGKGRPMRGPTTATALDPFGNVATGFSAAADPVTLRVDGAAVTITGLGGPGVDQLRDADDFRDGVATLDGRAVLVGAADGARLVAESARGLVGTSAPFAIQPVGPIPAAAALLLDVNRSGIIDEGDTITLSFDEDIVVNGATTVDIALNRPTDHLGAGATLAVGVRANELRITLGAGPVLQAPGLQSALTVRATNAIVAAAGGAPVNIGEAADLVPFPVRGPTVTNVGELRGAAASDLDGDGDLDLAVAAFQGHGRILLNDGSGTFTQTQTLAFPGGSASGRVAAGDLDGDGDTDLVFSTFSTVRIFRNDGGANFTADGEVPSPGYAIGIVNDVVLGDLDTDGDLDLVAATRSRHQMVYRNVGGTFEVADDIGDGYCERAALADVDSDGRLDVVLATVVNGPDGVIPAKADEVWRNDGDMDFTKLAEYGLVQRTWGLAAGDLDGDGRPDIVAGDQDDIRVYRNDGGGASFSLVATLDSRTFPFGILLADLDGDGMLDILTTRGFWLNDGDGRTFRFVAELDPAPRGRSALVTGDFDGDGHTDIVAANSKVEGLTTSPSILYFGAVAGN